MTRIDKPLTTAQFLENLPDIAGHRVDQTHGRHAQAVVRLINATAHLLETLKENDADQEWIAVIATEAALAHIREAV
jgi:ppGpp synthetase/RelA/SpoT-type nucleotidyltranferase